MTQAPKKFLFIVLVQAGEDVGPCHSALKEACLLDYAIVVTKEKDAEAFLVPDEEQVLMVVTTTGQYGTVFGWGGQMKQKYPKLQLGWCDTEPFARPPLNRMVARGEGETQFEELVEDAFTFLGLAIFQR